MRLPVNPIFYPSVYLIPKDKENIITAYHLGYRWNNNILICWLLCLYPLSQVDYKGFQEEREYTRKGWIKQNNKITDYISSYYWWVIKGFLSYHPYLRPIPSFSFILWFGNGFSFAQELQDQEKRMQDVGACSLVLQRRQHVL